MRRINEATTRKQLIYPALGRAGWNLRCHPSIDSVPGEGLFLFLHLNGGGFKAVIT